MTQYDALQLADGRTLELLVTGPADGPVLLFHHGTPGCAYQSRHVAEAVHARGMRLVSCSRPGYASSSRKPARTVADVAADSVEVLDALGADRAWVAGVSGGGPHTLACAALRPDRFAGALVIVGVAPYDVPGLDFLDGMGQANIDEFGAALAGEPQLRAYLDAQAAELRDGSADDLIASWESMLPEVDQAVLTSDVGADFMGNVHHALSGTVDGWLDDDLAFTRPWGFDPGEVRIPTVMWHGSADLMVPVAHGHWLAEHIAGVDAHVVDGEGHMSVRVGRMGEMIDRMLELAPLS